MTSRAVRIWKRIDWRGGGLVGFCKGRREGGGEVELLGMGSWCGLGGRPSRRLKRRGSRLLR